VWRLATEERLGCSSLLSMRRSSMYDGVMHEEKGRLESEDEATMTT
jgi:hypothetical protein